MSYFSERKGLKSAFVSASLALGLVGVAAYSHIEKDEPNPMAIVFAGIFAVMSGGSFREYRANAKAAQDTQKLTPKP